MGAGGSSVGARTFSVWRPKVTHWAFSKSYSEKGLQKCSIGAPQPGRALTAKGLASGPRNVSVRDHNHANPVLRGANIFGALLLNFLVDEHTDEGTIINIPDVNPHKPTDFLNLELFINAQENNSRHIVLKT